MIFAVSDPPIRVDIIMQIARQASLALRMLLALTIAPFALGSAADEAVVVARPYARAVPPGQPNSAVFMQIENRGRQHLALVAAESPMAEVVELHTHRVEDGMMKMRRIEQIELPPGEKIKLQPGGLHLMLIRLKQQLQPGDDVALTLAFDDGGELRLTAPVRQVTPMGYEQHGPGARRHPPSGVR